MLEKYLFCDETSENPDFSRRKSGVRVPSAPPGFEISDSKTEPFDTVFDTFGTFL